MAKSFVSVQDPNQLADIFVSEFDDGAIGYASSNATHYTLIHDPVGLPVAGRILPAVGSPRAGSPNAVWNPAL